jgi:hypothetical protein
MKDRIVLPQIDRAPASLAPSMNLPPKSFAQKLAERAAEAPAAATPAQLQLMAARIDALEETVRKLIECAVQQGTDGKVYLPVGNRLTIQTGNAWLIMSNGKFIVQVGGRTELSLPPIATTPSSGPFGLPSGSVPSNDWRSVAQTNVVDNPMNSPADKGSGFHTGRRTP